jgi:integrase
MELSLDESGSLRVRAHASAFKNARSRAVREIRPERPFMVRDSLGMKQDFLDYIEARGILLNGHSDPGTLFVKNMASRAKEPEMSGHAFYEMWLNLIRRYGIKNPFNGRGAIEGLGPHGPHGVRDVKATHALKTGGPGAIAEAAASLLDTEDMVRNHYALYLPQDGNQRVRDTYYDGLEERFS